MAAPADDQAFVLDDWMAVYGVEPALAHARDGGQASCKSDQLKLPTFLMVSAAQEPMLGPPRLFMRSSWVWWTFACPDSALWLLVFPSPLFLMPLQEGALHGSQ